MQIDGGKVIEYTLCFGLFLIVLILITLIRIRNVIKKHDEQTMNDYKNSEMGKSTRQNFIDKIKKGKK